MGRAGGGFRRAGLLGESARAATLDQSGRIARRGRCARRDRRGRGDRKSTRLNSSHRLNISYAVFCLKKKKPWLGNVRQLFNVVEDAFTTGEGLFFFNDPAPTEIYTLSDTLSLHDALPISRPWKMRASSVWPACRSRREPANGTDRKSTRLNSSHRLTSRMPSSA